MMLQMHGLMHLTWTMRSSSGLKVLSQGVYSVIQSFCTLHGLSRTFFGKFSLALTYQDHPVGPSYATGRQLSQDMIQSSIPL